MIYTAVFQDDRGQFSLETHVAAHDRNMAWCELYEKRKNKNACLVLLIDGHASVRTYKDIVDIIS